MVVRRVRAKLAVVRVAVIMAMSMAMPMAATCLLLRLPMRLGGNAAGSGSSNMARLQRQQSLRRELAPHAHSDLRGGAQRPGDALGLADLRFGRLVGLVEHDQIRALELLGEQLADALVAIGHAGDVRRRRRQLRYKVGREGGRVNDGDRAVHEGPLPFERSQCRRDAVGLGNAAQLDHDGVESRATSCNIRLGARSAFAGRPQHFQDVGPEFAGGCATDTAVGHLHALRAGLPHCAVEDAGIDVNGGEVVHDDA
mmetsp:Transcript_27123/g.76992  ORF Transcript_27123/g.76992 Transcript_27123/m.76992 type:complete len:255 (+) Transcript_27123:717-1481(+)